MKPLTLFAICISIAIHSAAAQDPSKRLDIVDCLELMPERVFADWWHPFAKIEVLKSEIRRAATQPASHFTLDVPNGYLHYPADDGGERCEMTTTLFRQPDGGALIAMECREVWEVLELDILPAHPELRNASGDPSATDTLRWFAVDENGWTEVTDSVMPEPLGRDLRYTLPRHGTTILLFRRGEVEPFRKWERSGNGFRAVALK